MNKREREPSKIPGETPTGPNVLECNDTYIPTGMRTLREGTRGTGTSQEDLGTCNVQSTTVGRRRLPKVTERALGLPVLPNKSCRNMSEDRED